MLLPERTQLQLIPKPASQPAVAKSARALESQLREFDLQAIKNIGRNIEVFRAEADLFDQVIGLIDHLQAFTPGRLLRGIDLARIENGTMCPWAGTHTAGCKDTYHRSVL